MEKVGYRDYRIVLTEILEVRGLVRLAIPLKHVSGGCKCAVARLNTEVF